VKFSRLQIILLVSNFSALIAGLAYFEYKIDFIPPDQKVIFTPADVEKNTYIPIEKSIAPTPSKGSDTRYSEENISGEVEEDISQDSNSDVKKLNINIATAQELEMLPHLDTNIAEKIIEYRTHNGAFTTLDDLTKVKGIEKKQIAQLKDFLFCDIADTDSSGESEKNHKSHVNDSSKEVAERPSSHKKSKEFAGKININTASVDELVSLPRIGPVTAKAIVEDRKKNGPFENIDDLTRVRGIGDKTVENLKDKICTEGGHGSK
jgi:comEA protein